MPSIVLFSPGRSIVISQAVQTAVGRILVCLLFAIREAGAGHLIRRVSLEGAAVSIIAAIRAVRALRLSSAVVTGKNVITLSVDFDVTLQALVGALSGWII